MESKDTTNGNVIEVKHVHSGNWWTFNTITLQANSKLIKNYEYIERTTKKTINSIDGVSIVALVTSKATLTKKLIIEANFRPPVNNYVLELPGGLPETDHGMEDALRELKEETGYIGKPIKTNLDSLKIPGVFFDPWKSTEKGKFVFAEVDGDDERNKNPKQNLDETEEIFVYLIDLDSNFLKNLEELSVKHGYDIDAQLYCIGLGLSLLAFTNI